jgi:IclR family transcriptional regulator, KDG regulon repressor
MKATPPGQHDDSTANRPNYQVRALERALRILDVFSLEAPEWTLTDISTQISLPKSTALRLTVVLEAWELLERSPDTERYRLGVRAFELGGIYIQSTSLEAEARPFLQELARTYQQTANLGILSGGEIVHIAVVAPERPIHFSAMLGQREQIHCTGLGKALVFDRPREELAALLSHTGLPARTQHTITDFDAFWQHLQEARQHGYALDDEESFIGVRCVAAPIRDARNAIVAALSISGPRGDLPASTLPDIAAAVIAAAQKVAYRLGQRIQEGGERTGPP